MITKRVWPRAMLTLAVAAVLVATAACTSDGTEDLPEQVSPPPTGPPEEPAAPDLTPEEQEAVDEAQALVEEFIPKYHETLNAGEDPVNMQITSPPLTGARSIDVWDEVGDNFENGRRGEGSIDWKLAEVAQVDLDRTRTVGDEEANVPLVRLRYCMDATSWQIVDKDNGDPLDPGVRRMMPQPGTRHPVLVDVIYEDPSPVEPRDNPQWWISAWENEDDQPC